MNHKTLWVMIEGDRDKDFFDRVLKSLYSGRYTKFNYWKHRQHRNDRTNRLLRTITEDGDDYVFFGDKDDFACISGKKAALKSAFCHVQEDHIFVVAKAIEAWYLAGLDQPTCRKLKIRGYLQNTNTVSKREFKSLMPPHFGSTVYFMKTILRCFSLHTAVNRNSSLSYFLRKQNLLP